MIQLLLAFERKVGWMVSSVARALLVAAVLAGLWQVLTRFVLEAPSDWTEVLTRTLLIWCVYLGTAVAFRRGALVSVDLMRASLRGRARRALETAITGLAFVFLALIGVLGAQLAWLTRFQTLIGLEIAISWAYLAIPVGCTLAALSVLAHHFDPVHLELETSV